MSESRRLWLAQAKDALSDGHSITICPTGSAMEPRIYSGDEVTLVSASEIAVGDVVLARVRRRRVVLHQVLAAEDGKYVIENASGREDGWIKASDVLGVAVRTRRAST